MGVLSSEHGEPGLEVGKPAQRRRDDVAELGFNPAGSTFGLGGNWLPEGALSTEKGRYPQVPGTFSKRGLPQLYPHGRCCSETEGILWPPLLQTERFGDLLVTGAEAGQGGVSLRKLGASLDCDVLRWLL